MDVHKPDCACFSCALAANKSARRAEMARERGLLAAIRNWWRR